MAFWIGAEEEFCEQQPFCYLVHDNLHKSTQPKHNQLKLNFKSINELQHGHMTSASLPLSFWHPSILKRVS